MATPPLPTKSFRKMRQHLALNEQLVVKLICVGNKSIKLIINMDSGSNPIMAPDPSPVIWLNLVSSLNLDYMSSDVPFSSMFILWFEEITPSAPDKPHQPSCGPCHTPQEPLAT